MDDFIGWGSTPLKHRGRSTDPRGRLIVANTSYLQRVSAPQVICVPELNVFFLENFKMYVVAVVLFGQKTYKEMVSKE